MGTWMWLRGSKMVTKRQRKEIKKRMRAIKEARDNNMHKRVIEERAEELTNYLQSEGLINPFDE